MVRSLPVQKPKNRTLTLPGRFCCTVSPAAYAAPPPPLHLQGFGPCSAITPCSTTVIWWGTAFSTLSIYKFSKLFYLLVIEN